MEVISRLRCFSQLAKCTMHTSAPCCTKPWRLSKGLPLNKTSAGPLTDLPDYTFLDGRVTPIGFRQKKRLMQQREFTKQMVQYIYEVDSAKQRQLDIIAQREDEEQKRLNNQLKPKGKLLLKNKN